MFPITSPYFPKYIVIIITVHFIDKYTIVICYGLMCNRNRFERTLNVFGNNPGQSIR